MIGCYLPIIAFVYASYFGVGILGEKKMSRESGDPTGKTVKSFSQDRDSGVIIYTDGTYSLIGGYEHANFDILLEIYQDELEFHPLVPEVYSADELQVVIDKQEEQYRQYQKQQRKRDYKYLKKEFDNEV